MDRGRSIWVQGYGVLTEYGGETPMRTLAGQADAPIKVSWVVNWDGGHAYNGHSMIEPRHAAGYSLAHQIRRVAITSRSMTSVPADLRRKLAAILDGCDLGDQEIPAGAVPVVPPPAPVPVPADQGRGGPRWCRQAA